MEVLWLLLSYGAGVLLAIAFFGIIVYIVSCLGIMKIFEKSGQDSWIAFIPIYNIYTLYKIAWDVKFAYLNFALILLAIFLPHKLYIFSTVINLSIWGMNFGLSYFLSKAFGKKLPMAVGLTLIPFVFQLILGFGNAKYEGNKSAALDI